MADNIPAIIALYKSMVALYSQPRMQAVALSSKLSLDELEDGHLDAIETGDTPSF